LTKRPEIIDLALAGQLGVLLQASTTPDFSKSRCAGMPVNLFFNESKTAVAKAKEICSTCPIMNQCAEWAASNAEDGIFGGLTAKERKVKFAGKDIQTTTSRHDLAKQLDFVMTASAREVALRYAVEMRTVVRWRNVLRPMKEVA
jgi:predicted RecB family nuclease